MGLKAANWHGRRVLVTGHTGFKGSWLSLWLHRLGAQVHGYALAPDTRPSLFEAARIEQLLHGHVLADVRDADLLAKALDIAAPDMVVHLAAQPLVRRSYREPVATFATNIMGTVHLLEAVRRFGGRVPVLVVTTDKCYASRDGLDGYPETASLGGADPYSASKACAELVAAAYRDSYFATRGIAIATARAGNVIGGGDWAEDRLVADAVRAFSAGRPLEIRAPRSVRPWQHVLDVLDGYIRLLQALVDAPSEYAEAWNFGPSPAAATSVSAVASELSNTWGNGARWVAVPQPDAPRETSVLQLDASKASRRLGWECRLSIPEAIAWTIRWYRAYEQTPERARALCERQLDAYMALP